MKNIVPKLELISRENSNIGTLAKYLLEYQGDLAELTISKLSEELFISIATATRLSKRLDLEGFSQLKIYLAQEQCRSEEIRRVYQDQIFDSYYQDATNILKHTLSSIDNNLIKIVSDEMRVAAKINFFAVGSSNVAVRYLAQKLFRFNKSVTHHSDPHLQYVEAMNSNSTVVNVGVSYSGLTHEILGNLQIGKERGATTVLITSNKKVKYDFIDYIIVTPIVDVQTGYLSISNRFSSVIVLDLIYLNIIEADPVRYRQMLEYNSYIK